MLSARESALRTELPKGRVTGAAAQTKEKWLEFDPEVKDIIMQQARGHSYERQLPLLLQRTGKRFTKYAQRDLNRRVKHFIQSGDLGFTLYVRAVVALAFGCVGSIADVSMCVRYDSDNDSEDEAGGIKPLHGPAAIETDSHASKELLNDLGTVQWTRESVRSTSPDAFADSTYHVVEDDKTAATSVVVQETESSKAALIEDQEAVLNFSIAHKASATISTILARVNANIRSRGGKWKEPRDHAKSGQVKLYVRVRVHVSCYFCNARGDKLADTAWTATCRCRPK